MPMTSADALAAVKAKFDRSRKWMQDNVYDDFANVLRQYYCIPGEYRHAAGEGPNDNSGDRKPPFVRGTGIFGPDNREILTGTLSDLDASIPEVVMPDTWGLVRRQVARLTGNIANLNYRDSDKALANRVSTYMKFCWDNGKYMRKQKRHVASALLFGLGVKLWFWERQTHSSYIKVDVSRPLDPGILESIQREYAPVLVSMPPLQPGMDPTLHTQQMLMLLASRFGKGKYLPVHRTFTGYVGPQFQNVSMANFFPMPDFIDIQDGWTIIRTRRDRAWLEKLGEIYDETYDPLSMRRTSDGVVYADTRTDDDAVMSYGLQRDQLSDLLRDHKYGLRMTLSDGDPLPLMEDAVGYAAGRKDADETKQNGDGMYDVLEVHYGGDNFCVEYIVGDQYYLGKFSYPWEFESRNKPLTDLTFIDSVMGDGMGDSSARIIRDLVDLHTRQNSYKEAAIHQVIRPKFFTDDDQIMNNPGKLARGAGFSVIKIDGTIKPFMEPNAIQGINSVLNNEGSNYRAIQMATGESNMSMAANVDPAQAATATGARIVQGNLDIISKEQLEMLNIGVKADLDMMFELTKSELDEEVRFDSSPYRSTNPVQTGQTGQPGPVPEGGEIGGEMDGWVIVHPEDFNGRPMLEPVVGSTLADDDEKRIQEAQILFNAAAQLPQVINIETAAVRLLTAMGEGRNLPSWKVPPQPPPPPPVPEPQSMRKQVNWSVPVDKLPVEFQAQVLPLLVGELVAEQQLTAPPEPEAPIADPEMPVDPGAGGAGGAGVPEDMLDMLEAQALSQGMEQGMGETDDSGLPTLEDMLAGEIQPDGSVV